MSDIVIGIIAGSIVALISFILGLFGQIWYGRLQEKRQRQHNSLKQHFLDLNEKTITPLISQLETLQNDLGEISFGGQGRYWSPHDMKFLPRVLTEDWRVFSLHFPAQAATIDSLVDQINNHNKEFDELIKLLEAHLNKIYPLARSIKEPPFLTGELLGFMRTTIFQAARKEYALEFNEDTFEIIDNYPITHDFNKSSIVKENEYWLLVNTPKGNGMKYAILTSKEEAEYCMKSLVALQNSPEFLQEAYKLFEYANLIMGRNRLVADSLAFLRQCYKELGKTLKRVKSCPFCRVIYEEHPR